MQKKVNQLTTILTLIKIVKHKVCLQRNCTFLSHFLFLSNQFVLLFPFPKEVRTRNMPQLRLI